MHYLFLVPHSVARWCLVTIFLLLAGIQAETLPPGIYHESGRVILRSDGDYRIWSGGSIPFPMEEQQKLMPFLGQFVSVDYQRVADRSGMVGSVVGGIEKIIVKARSPMDLPVTVVVTPFKSAFRMIEPVEGKVTILNQSDKVQAIQFQSSYTNLSQDFDNGIHLESGEAYNDYSAYHFPDGLRPKTIESIMPGERIEFSLKSNKMIEPGNYTLVYRLNIGSREWDIQSERVDIEILATDETERRSALWSWLKTASPAQRTEIAEKLLKLGDTEAITEFMDQLKNGALDKAGPDIPIRFAFKYGGDEGARIVLDKVKKSTGQDRAGRMICWIYLSKDPAPLLFELLGCEHPTMKDIADWVDEPRICDITAAWLMGYTDEKMLFPKIGSLEARNDAVKTVIHALKKDPSMFRV